MMIIRRKKLIFNTHPLALFRPLLYVKKPIEVAQDFGVGKGVSSTPETTTQKLPVVFNHGISEIQDARHCARLSKVDEDHLKAFRRKATGNEFVNCTKT